MEATTRSSTLPLFPAITRAKQHFLARQRAPPAAPPREAQAGSTGQTLSSAKASLLQDVCDTIDTDLLELALDVDSIDADVRSAHERICSDLDALTAWFVAPHLPAPVPSHTLVPALPRVDAETEREQAASTDTVAPATAAAAPIQLAQQDMTRTAPQSTATRSVTPAPCPSSRAARLALAAVHAHVIQQQCRRFLYSRLYPGGQLQFARARQLCVRVALAHGWRRWRSAVQRRQRHRTRFAASVRRLGDTAHAHHISIARAERVRMCDGEYAVAKRYYETRVLCLALRTWFAALARG